MLAAMLVFAWTSGVSAFELTNESDGFSMSLEPIAGEKLCVVAPRGHIDPSTCGPITAESMEPRLLDFATKDQQMIGLAILDRGGAQAVVTVIRAFPVAPEMTAHVDTFVGGMKKEMGSARHLGNRIVILAERDALQVDFVDDAPGGTGLSTRFLAFPSRDVNIIISIAAQQGNEAWLEELTKRITPSIRAKRWVASQPGERPIDEVDRARAKGQLFGHLARIAVFALVVIGAVIYGTRRNARMRKQTAERLAQGLIPNDKSRRD